MGLPAWPVHCQLAHRYPFTWAPPSLPAPSALPADEPPLALGQWLESKGLVSWAPRGGLKIGPSGGGIAGGGSSGAAPGPAATAGGPPRLAGAACAGRRTHMLQLLRGMRRQHARVTHPSPGLAPAFPGPPCR